MTSNDWAHIRSELEVVLANVAGDLPAQHQENVASLIDAGEFGVAFEILCTQLFEYDVTPQPDDRARLAAVGRRLELEPSVWEVLDE